MTKKHEVLGFTLIEVIVAVAIIAIGLAATIKTVSTVTRNTASLNERIIATWVAQNVLAQYELDLNNKANKDTHDKMLMAGLDWYWEKTLHKTDDIDIKRVEIKVRKDNAIESHVYAEITTLHLTHVKNGEVGKDYEDGELP